VLGRKGSVWEKPPRREPPIAAEVRDDAARKSFRGELRDLKGLERGLIIVSAFLLE